MPPARTRLDPGGLYARLGVAASASPADIATAYRRQARVLHPDVSDTGDTEAFIALQQAYDTLSDPQHRATYDRNARTAALETTEAGEIVPAAPAETRPAPVPRPRMSDLPLGLWIGAALLIGVGVVETVMRLTARHDPSGPAVRTAAPGADRSSPRAADNDRAAGAQAGAARMTADPANGRDRGDPEPRAYPAFSLRAPTRAGGGQVAGAPETPRTGVAQSAGNSPAAPTPVGPAIPAKPSPAPENAAGQTVAAQPAPVQLAGTPNFYIVPAAGPTILWGVDGERHNLVAVGQVPPFSAVQAIRLYRPNGLVEVRLTESRTALIEAARLAPGNPGAARRAYCAYYAGAPPANGEVLERHAVGAGSIDVSNRTGQPVVVKLRDAAGALVASVFLAPQGTATVSGLPTGRYRPDFAIGEFWSRACNSFAAGMRAQRFAEALPLDALDPLSIPPQLATEPPQEIPDRLFEAE